MYLLNKNQEKTLNIDKLIFFYQDTPKQNPKRTYTKWSSTAIESFDLQFNEYLSAERGYPSMYFLIHDFYFFISNFEFWSSCLFFSQFLYFE